MTMEKHIFRAEILFEILADSEEEAATILQEGLDGGNFHDWEIEDGEWTTATYAVPVGAERWGAAGKRIDFDNDADSVGTRGGTYDGSWWWTNSHVLLRCEGTLPEGAIEVESPKFEGAFASTLERKATTWSDEMPASDGSRMRGRRALAKPTVCIQWKYFDLIEQSVPGCQWMIADEPRTPIYALDAEGKLVAVVMPMVEQSLAPLESAAE